MIGDIQQLGQTGIFVTADRGVEHVVGEDAGLLGVVADPTHGVLGQRAGLGDAQVNAVGGRGRHRDHAPGVTVRSTTLRPSSARP